MLEVVSIYFTAVNNVVGLYIVGEFKNFKGDAFFSKDIFGNGKDFSMGCGEAATVMVTPSNAA